ncbi:DUF3046 domain-containing protein [Leucobacter denitrificans]|uniref:DUF3046 domain-containing protein n=1 Tax=Leucobacter denitrificans TaxID=683042 RepID=A0A7G9S4Q6_9MICO|nr:DUF3046 domain-containing protein [Leucobacter denitrificans]QNN62831.1 DUF3046 domain-containing protein [Leucobacter denitrificans]
MRHRAFRKAVAEEFGEAHSGVLMRDYWIASLGSTPDEALSHGVTPRTVWEALCIEFEVPESRRHGRSLDDPRE